MNLGFKMNKEDCLKFFEDKTTNPLTGRKIKVGGKTYKNFEQQCQIMMLFSDRDISIKENYFFDGISLNAILYLDYLSRTYDVCFAKMSSKSAFLKYDTKKGIFLNNILFDECDKDISLAVLGIEDHANALLINNKDKTVERFEPHGYIKSEFYDHDKIDHDLEKYFKKKRYKYIRTVQECHIGPQNIEAEAERTFGDPSGYCVAWSLWYLEMRLRNLEVPRNKLFSMMENKSSTSSRFHNFIRAYSQNIINQKLKYYKWFADKKYKTFQTLLEMYDTISHNNDDNYNRKIFKWIYNIEIEHVYLMNDFIELYLNRK